MAMVVVAKSKKGQNHADSAKAHHKLQGGHPLWIQPAATLRTPASPWYACELPLLQFPLRKSNRCSDKPGALQPPRSKAPSVMVHKPPPGFPIETRANRFTPTPRGMRDPSAWKRPCSSGTARPRGGPADQTLRRSHDPADCRRSTRTSLCPARTTHRHQCPAIRIAHRNQHRNRRRGMLDAKEPAP